MEKLDLVNIQIALGYWGELPAQFQKLTPDQQERYLFVQGYPRFADLLAHIIAWWERGMILIAKYRTDASFLAPKVDVDDFNARAVASVRGTEEEEIITAFEEARHRFIKLIAELDDKETQDERIIRQIEMELIGHFKEHKIN